MLLTSKMDAPSLLISFLIMIYITLSKLSRRCYSYEDIIALPSCTSLSLSNYVYIRQNDGADAAFRMSESNCMYQRYKCFDSSCDCALHQQATLLS